VTPYIFCLIMEMIVNNIRSVGGFSDIIVKVA
jgi:hypothetical protein